VAAFITFSTLKRGITAARKEAKKKESKRQKVKLVSSIYVAVGTVSVCGATAHDLAAY
jgi:hypothetical protein